jgi:phage anti-repressor protein/phage antirepressor YoqD-like protein
LPSYPSGKSHLKPLAVELIEHHQKEPSMQLSYITPPGKEHNMNELIHIAAANIGGEEIQTVNARDLHAFLEVRKDFSDWIKAQLDGTFTQGIDFETFPPKGERENQALSGWKVRIDYALTIDCAKHIAMMSRTEKGRQARDYFLECERRAKNPVPAIAVPQTLPEALRLAANLAEKAAALECKIVEQAPKIAALSRIEASEKSLTFTQSAKVLGVKREELIRRLHAEGWIYRQNKSWVAHAAAIRAGRLEYKETHYTDNDGHEQVNPYCHLTPKGMTQIATILGVDDLFQQQAA